MRRFAVIAPAPIKGSGGVARIFKYASALAETGFQTDVYVFDGAERGEEQIAREAQSFYGASGFRVHAHLEIEGRYDFAMATRWDTAQSVRESQAKHKLYLVQDFEAYFNPVGDGTILAENSYLYGLYPITYGRWLANKLSREYGCRPYWLDFAADLDHFNVQVPYRDRDSGELSICFIYQHDKPRRCPQLGIEALAIVQSVRPKTKIHLVGSEQGPSLGINYRNSGILSPEALNSLYNHCHLGLCLSSTNPSCNPFDMMAAGLPSVELYRENNLYDLPEEGVLLAHQTPESIAEALIHLLDNRSRRTEMSDSGIVFMRDRAAAMEVRSFLKIVERIGQGISPPPIADSLNKQMYSKAAVVSSAYSYPSVQAHVMTQGSSNVPISANVESFGEIQTFGLVTKWGASTQLGASATPKTKHLRRRLRRFLRRFPRGILSWLSSVRYIQD